MTEAIEPAPGFWNSPRMQARIRRRYRVERLFRATGFFALAAAAAFLLFLLGSIVASGWTSFLQTEVRLTVTLDPTLLGVTEAEGRADPARLLHADYGAVVQQAARSLGGAPLVSDGAWLALRRAVVDDPAVIGTKQTLWLIATSTIDQLQKGRIDATSDGPASQAEIALWRDLQAKGDLRTVLNRTFLSGADSVDPELAGIWGALKGSFLTLLVTLAISFPVGVLTAIYLEEFAPKNRWTDVVEVSINNLAAVPSIIFGLLGLAIFLNILHMPRSAPIVGGLTLALMTLPVIVISSRAAVQAVPPSIRDAALGVGASRVQVVFHHVLPLALPGMLTGTILGLARALGETAPLLLIGMRAFLTSVPRGLDQPATLLPVQVFIWSDNVSRGFVEKTSGAIIVLLAFLLATNSLAIYLRNRFEVHW